MSVVVCAAVIHGWCTVVGELCAHCVSYTALVEEVVCWLTRRDRFPQTGEGCAGPPTLGRRILATLSLHLPGKRKSKQWSFGDVLLGTRP